MPKGRAAAAISAGHGSFYLGDRTESRNECKHSISEVFAKSIGSSPGPNRSASGSAARSNPYSSPPSTAKLWCGQGGMGAESFGFVGRVSHGNSTAHHLESNLLVFKDIDMKRAEEASALIGERTSSTPLNFALGTAQRRPNCRARILSREGRRSSNRVCCDARIPIVNGRDPRSSGPGGSERSTCYLAAVSGAT